MCNCAEFERNLGCYLDGELPAEDAAVMEGHLAECASCRAALEALRAVDSAAREVAEPGERQWRSAWDGISAKTAGVERRRLLFSRIWGGAAWAAAAAAAVVAFYVLAPRPAPAGGPAASAFEVVSIEVEAPGYTPVIMTGDEKDLPVIWLERS